MLRVHIFDACWSPRRSAGARRATLPPPDPPTGGHLSAQRPKSAPNLSKSLIPHVYRDAPPNTELLVLTPSLLSPFSLLPSSLPHLPPPPRFTHPSAGAGWLAGWPAGHVVPRRSENCLIVRACICSWAPLDNSQEAPGQLLGSSWAARGQVLGSSCLRWAHKAFASIRLRIYYLLPYSHVKAICFHVRDARGHKHPSIRRRNSP